MQFAYGTVLVHSSAVRWRRVKTYGRAVLLPPGPVVLRAGVQQLLRAGRDPETRVVHSYHFAPCPVIRRNRLRRLRIRLARAALTVSIRTPGPVAERGPPVGQREGVTGAQGGQAHL